MILTSLNGVNTMLFINNTVTSDEYAFLERSSTIRNNYYFEDWWTDTPLKDSLLLYSSNLTQTILLNTFYVTEDHQTKVNLNSTLATTKIIINADGTSTTTIIPPTFKYILLSPRMEKSAFFLLNTNHRTVQINQPIPDIWKDLSDWKLIEEYRNIKVYKWLGTE
jgi:hypothetical protein